MADKIRVTVNIAGVEYALSGLEGEEHIRACAELVDARMMEISQQFFQLSETMVAVLAACNVADEYLKLCDKSQRVLDLDQENVRLQKENESLLREIARISNSQARNNARSRQRKDTPEE